MNTPKFWMDSSVCIACEPIETYRRNTEGDSPAGEKLFVRNKMTREETQ